MVSSAYLRLLIFFPTILIPAYALSSPTFCILHSAYKLSRVTIYSLDVLLSQFGTSPLLANGLELDQSMSSSNCCFLTCIQISQEAGQMVQYSHLFKNFPQFAVIHSQWSRSRCFFWNSLAFSMIQQILAIWSLVPLPFLKLAWTSGSSWLTYCCGSKFK